jgi:hypothetical protein
MSPAVIYSSSSFCGARRTPGGVRTCTASCVRGVDPRATFDDAIHLPPVPPRAPVARQRWHVGVLLAALVLISALVLFVAIWLIATWRGGHPDRTPAPELSTAEATWGPGDYETVADTWADAS